MSSRRHFRRCSRQQSGEVVADPQWTDLDLYKIALDEYRFQVNLNWSRTQYFIALNLLLFGSATTLVSGRPPSSTSAVGAAVVYAVGALTSVMSLAASRTQRAYYHGVRERKRLMEERLDLGELAINTTPGMKARGRRLGKVHHVHSTIIGAVLVLDVAGVAIAVWFATCQPT